MEGHVFPYQPVQGNFETLNVDDFIGKKKITELLGRAQAFTAYLQKGRMAASPADSKFNLIGYFKYSVNEALKMEQFNPGNMFWERVEQRLEKPSQGKSKKNTDLRTFFRIDAHKFLVPGLFTFGQRTVPAGLIHLVELTYSPMCAYKLSEVALLERKVVVKESQFEATDEMWYDRFVLQPHTRYQFEAGVTYVIVSPLKSLFSLHVLVEPNGAKFGENPFEHRKLLDDPYKVMPSTPIPMPMPGPSRKRQREEEDDLPFLMPTLPPQKRQREDDAFLLPPATTVSKKRSREEEEVDAFWMPSPEPSTSKKRQREEEVDAFWMPSPEPSTSKKIQREEEVDALPMPTLPAETTTSKKRALEKDDDCLLVEESSPKIVVWSKGTYDYPHPEASTVWFREIAAIEEIVENIKKQNVPVQEEPINYCVRPEKPDTETAKEPEIPPQQHQIEIEPDIVVDQLQNEMAPQEQCISPQNQMAGEQYVPSENQMAGEQYVPSENQMAGEQYVPAENQMAGEQSIPPPMTDLDSLKKPVTEKGDYNDDDIFKFFDEFFKQPVAKEPEIPPQQHQVELEPDIVDTEPVKF